MPTGWGRGLSAKPLTPQERAEGKLRAKLKLQAQIRKLDRKGKVALLARAIANAAIRHGEITLQDCIQAGFTETEARDLYPDAIVIARRLEPSMMQVAA